MNQPASPNQTPAAPVSPAGGAVGGPLIDRMGRTFDQCRALGLKVINRLHPVTKFFMPKGGRKPGSKNKSKMDNPLTPAPGEQPSASINADSGAAGSPQPPPPPQAEIPGMAELKAALAEETPTGEPGASPAAPKHGDEFTMAAAGTVAGIQTLAILAMGAHVKPTGEQTAAMVDAYASAFRHYGYKPEVPPWLGPVIATALWVGPHFADERSQSSLQRWKQKAVNAWLWVQGKFDSRAAASAARETQT